MNHRPLVSIIIDNYNYGRFLREAIDSALHQTYDYTEIIVVDDGSTDDSPAIIQEYGNTIIAIIKQNGGQASAFNEGFKASRGQIIVFLDSDDMLLPTAIEQVVLSFNNPDVSKVHWPMWRIDGSGGKNGEIVPVHPLAQGDLLKQLIQHGPAYFCGTAVGSPTSGNAWSRSFLDQVFPLPESDFKTGGVDFYLFVLAPVYGQVRTISKPQGLYRVHGSNDTLKSADAYLQTFFGWFDQSWEALYHHLLAQDIPVDANTWKRNSWYHQIHASMQEIVALVPPTHRFILVDENYWATGDTLANRHRVPFIEQNGQYWGPPANDSMAIEEIERQRTKGSAFIFFAWPAFWWLDYYTGMRDYLKANYLCVINNERLIGFGLQSNTAVHEHIEQSSAVL
ncbi:hypothetical protein GCM10023189_16550 [Nibrella saemangeumensis]|uniref:Glycosyltransferase 2-like domain-containing protein n=1 Tax=Nibrella saemangeumensis TaxID=1084526 RepID=A0ABP8MNY9_9BACT